MTDDGVVSREMILSTVDDGERRAGPGGGKPVPSDVDDISSKRGGSPREA